MSRRMLLLSVAAIAAAQQVEPVYRAGTQLVQVDVEVRNEKGAVRGLTKDDFILQDKGKAQAISLFAMNETGPDAPKAAPLPAGVVSNRINADGESAENAVVILFDRLNIIDPPGSTSSSSSTAGGAFSALAAGAQARAGRQILEVLASLKPSQRVGLYSLFQDLTVVRDFTEDPTPLIESAKRLLSSTPETAPTPEGQALDKSLRDALTTGIPLDQTVRAEITQRAFRGIARRMDGVQGRKSLIWIVSSFPLTFGNDASRRSNDEAEVNAVANELSDANVAVYAIDPRGAGTGLGQASTDTARGTQQEGHLMNGRGGAGGGLGSLDASSQSVSTLSGPQAMETIASQTGGESLISVNDISRPIRDVIDTSSVSYTLGFYVDGKALDNKKHELTVKLAKKAETAGAKALYRRSYIATARTDHPQMNELIADRLDANRVGLMAVALPAPNRPGVDAVQIRVDLKDLQFEKRADKWVASFDLALAIDGQTQANISPENLSLSDDQLKQGLAGGVTIDNTVPAPGKAATLRVVVQDKSSGEAGSVRIPLPGK